MKHLLFVVCVGIVLLLPLRTDAGPAHGDSPKATISITSNLAVGGTILLPGEYRFQCREFDGKTFLVVTSVETGKEITRVRCVRETLEAKITDSEFRAVIGADGGRQLQSVRIRGEKVAHRLVQ